MTISTTIVKEAKCNGTNCRASVKKEIPTGHTVAAGKEFAYILNRAGWKRAQRKGTRIVEMFDGSECDVKDTWIAHFCPECQKKGEIEKWHDRIRSERDVLE